MLEILYQLINYNYRELTNILNFLNTGAEEHKSLQMTGHNTQPNISNDEHSTVLIDR